MKADSFYWSVASAWDRRTQSVQASDANLVLYFGGCEDLADGQRHEELTSLFPNALIIGCSGGSVLNPTCADDVTVSAVAVSFQKTRVALASAELDAFATAEACRLRAPRSSAQTRHTKKHRCRAPVSFAGERRLLISHWTWVLTVDSRPANFFCWIRAMR